MDNPRVGMLLRAEPPRDAIHIAIAPIVAGEPLQPGEPVGMAGTSANPLGIVDPFLKAPVAKGDRFWMFLYPNTITSLRHNWTHPGFEVGADQAKAISQIWMDNYAKELGVETFELLDAGISYVKYDDYWTEGGRFEGWSLSDDFWPHFEVLTGVKADEGKRGSFFNCSC